MQRALRVLLGRGDLLAGELAGGDRVVALDAGGDLAVGDAFDLERMQLAELGDLVERSARCSRPARRRWLSASAARRSWWACSLGSVRPRGSGRWPGGGAASKNKTRGGCLLIGAARPNCNRWPAVDGLAATAHRLMPRSRLGNLAPSCRLVRGRRRRILCMKSALLAAAVALACLVRRCRLPGAGEGLHQGRAGRRRRRPLRRPSRRPRRHRRLHRRPSHGQREAERQRTPRRRRTQHPAAAAATSR